MYTEYKVSFGNDINCSNDAITVATKSRWETVESGTLPTTPERISMDGAANQSFSNNMTSLEILKNVFGHQ